MMSTLDAIDATLAGLCACGCGRSLEHSPSAWYATEGCQRRHLSSQATDADEVYRRPDAHPETVLDATRIAAIFSFAEDEIGVLLGDEPFARFTRVAIEQPADPSAWTTVDDLQQQSPMYGTAAPRWRRRATITLDNSQGRWRPLP